MPALTENEIRLQLQRALDDPQWPQHAEVSKDLLRGLAGLLHQLQAQALAAPTSQPSSVAMTDERRLIAKLVALWDAGVARSVSDDDYQEEMCRIEDAMRALSSPQEASKPQDERQAHDKWFYSEYPQADRIPKGEHRMSLNGWIAGRASQPSAASGRELPPLLGNCNKCQQLIAILKEVQEACFYWDDDGRQCVSTEATIHYDLFNSICAALTGAAPADANVDGQDTVKALAEGGVLSHGVIQNLEEARDAADQARREGLQGMYPAACIVLDMAFSRLSHAIRTTAAPEPSAPAGKVDAERYRTLRANMTFHDIDHRFDVEGRNIPVLARVSKRVWYHATDDIQNDGLDAAIDRMRSESGKGGKL